MFYEMIVFLMFLLMMLMLFIGQWVFGVIGGIVVIVVFVLWGMGGQDILFLVVMKLMKWYLFLILLMFIFMGYVLLEIWIVDDLYKMFYVWIGLFNGGLVIGMILLMVLILVMNGLFVVGMVIGVIIVLLEFLKCGYDKCMVMGVIQVGLFFGILVLFFVVLVFYVMIVCVLVGQFWFVGIILGLMMVVMFVIYIGVCCKFQLQFGLVLVVDEWVVLKDEKYWFLLVGFLLIVIFVIMMVLFVNGWMSFVESFVIGVLMVFVVFIFKCCMILEILVLCLKKMLGIFCMFMWIILVVFGFGVVFDGFGVVKVIENLFIQQLGLLLWMILILMQLLFLVMGIFLDDIVMLVIVVLFYVLLVVILDFGMLVGQVLIWYGVFYMIIIQIVYMMLFFGYNFFLMWVMVFKSIIMCDIYGLIILFVLVMVLVFVFVMVFL